ERPPALRLLREKDAAGATPCANWRGEQGVSLLPPSPPLRGRGEKERGAHAPARLKSGQAPSDGSGCAEFSLPPARDRVNHGSQPERVSSRTAPPGGRAGPPPAALPVAPGPQPGAGPGNPRPHLGLHAPLLPQAGRQGSPGDPGQQGQVPGLG